MQTLKQLLNRLFRHERDRHGDYGYRAFLHFWLGLVMGIPFLGWAIIPIFVAYEESEDKHVHDRAWLDYAGALTGMVVMALLLTAGAILYLKGALR